jgi:hypothetical protein
MKTRQSLPTLLVLLQAAERFRAGAENEADRQLIGMLLSGVAADLDVRGYFWTKTHHRPTEHNPLKHWAAVVAAVAEARGEKLVKVRNGKAAEATGLTRGQVDHAIRDCGDVARFKVEMFRERGLLDQLEQWAATEIARLREK